ncbi:hypothetical protein [Streptomyces lividans]
MGGVRRGPGQESQDCLTPGVHEPAGQGLRAAEGKLGVADAVQVVGVASVVEVLRQEANQVELGAHEAVAFLALLSAADRLSQVGEVLGRAEDAAVDGHLEQMDVRHDRPAGGAAGIYLRVVVFHGVQRQIRAAAATQGTQQTAGEYVGQLAVGQQDDPGLARGARLFVDVDE